MHTTARSRVRRALRPIALAACVLSAGSLAAGSSPEANQGQAPAAAPSGAAAPSTLDPASCKGCHEKQISALLATPHRGERPAAGLAASPQVALPALCQSCHGTIEPHGEGTGGEGKALIPVYAKLTSRERSAPCLVCHSGAMAQHWPGSVHDVREVSCTDCHRMHPSGRPLAGLPAKVDEVETCTSCHLTLKGIQWRSSRHPMREGRFVCSGCHDPHGTMADAQLRRATVNETCLECHAEKRGPFLWSHPPVEENCLTCHLAHGSLHDALLIMKPPRLCQSCHNEPLHVSLPYSVNRKEFVPSRFVFNRGCDNCHQVHGSNSPSGPTLLR